MKIATFLKVGCGVAVMVIIADVTICYVAGEAFYHIKKHKVI